MIIEKIKKKIVGLAMVVTHIPFMMPNPHAMPSYDFNEFLEMRYSNCINSGDTVTLYFGKNRKDLRMATFIENELKKLRDRAKPFSVYMYKTKSLYIDRNRDGKIDEEIKVVEEGRTVCRDRPFK